MGRSTAKVNPETEVGPEIQHQPWIVQVRTKNASIASARAELEKRVAMLNIDRSVYAELESYLAVKALLPEMLTAEDRESVQKAQRALYELQGKLDRVAVIHLGARRIIRALGRLEVMSKSALADSGHITEKTSKPSADQLIALVLPELVSYQVDWAALLKMCDDVIDHLSNAKDVLKLQMKMDENLHWAKREGA